MLVVEALKLIKFSNLHISILMKSPALFVFQIASSKKNLILKPLSMQLLVIVSKYR